MNNPFDLANYKPQIDMRDVSRALKQSHQQSAVINQRRANGIEPNALHLPGSRDEAPARFAAVMPVMPKSKPLSGAAKRRAAKRQEVL